MMAVDLQFIVECKLPSLPLTWCRDLDLPNATQGCLDTALIKTAVWAKNEAEIKLMVSNMPKIEDRYSDDRKERD